MALYLQHFGLAEPPFRITPHPEFFYEGADRGATLEGLLYAILHDEGIVKVSGEIGSGKTTLCRVLMERLPGEVETVFLANPSYSRSEILHAILEELGRPAEDERGAAPSALRDLQSRLIELYSAGRRVVVMIDEAHAMPEDTLEQVRLLSNLETRRHKLLQIVLFGQPELDEALAKPTLRQLKDRITHSFRTRPLAHDEIAKYVSFRMRAAGYKGPDVFSESAIRLVGRGSSGLTRRINVLCDKALLAAYAANAHAVTPREVRAAIADSDFAPLPGASGSSAARHRWLALAALLLLAVAAVLAGLLWLQREPDPAPIPAQPPRPKAAAVEPAVPTGGAAPAAAAPAVSAPPVPPVPPPAALNAEQLRRFDGYAAGRNLMLRDRLAATRERLLREPDGKYSIELFIADNSDPARTERFLVRAAELVPLEDILVIPLANRSRYQLRVAFGVFDGAAAAAAAAKRLPPKYQNAFHFEYRSFADLRAAL